MSTDTLDDLLTARAAAGDSSAAASIPSSGPNSDALDTLLAARAAQQNSGPPPVVTKAVPRNTLPATGVNAQSAMNSASIGDIVAGLPATRMIAGLASPIVGAAQLGANAGDWLSQKMGNTPVLGQYLADKIKSYEDAKSRGMAALGDNGSDLLGVGGSMVMGAGMFKGVTPAATYLGKLGQGASIGAVSGATTPSEVPGLGQTLTQAKQGAALGAAIPAVTNALRLAGNAPIAPTIKNESLQAGHDIGMVAIPSTTGAGWLNSFLESIAGKAPLRTDAILKNQAARNLAAPTSVGLPEGTQITPGLLSTIRSDADTAGYLPIKQLGDIPTKNTGYPAAISAIDQTYGMPQGTPSVQNPLVSSLVSNELDRPSFNGPDILKMIQNYREVGNNAASNYGSGAQVKGLGKAQVAGSDALTDLIAEHLTNQGPQPASGLVQNMLDSRKLMAKTYTLGNAVNPGDANVSAAPFVDRLAENLPLDGVQKNIAQFATAFPKVSVTGTGVTPNPPVTLLAPAVAALSGNAALGAKGIALGAIPLSRAPIRHMLLSNWYQNKFATGAEPNSLTPEQIGALTRILGAN